MPKTGYTAFEALDLFFEVVMEGLRRDYVDSLAAWTAQNGAR